MIALPSELLLEIFYLVCAADDHNIEQKLLLAQVCGYWRAVALDCPTFWARIMVRTPRDATRLPISLVYSGDAALDIELPWGWHLRSDAAILSASEQRAVVAVLTVLRPRIKRLYVDYTYAATAESLHPLIGAGLDFPALEDLEIQGQYDPPYLNPRLEAPSLRRLAISDVMLDTWDTLIVPSLEHLYLDAFVSDEPAPLITAILSRCSTLRYFGWNVGSATLDEIDATVQVSNSLVSNSLVPRLHTLRLGRCVNAYGILRTINQSCHTIHDITMQVYYGHGIDDILELLMEVFHGTSSLVDLRMDETGKKVIIRDDAGRIRVCHDNSTWSVNDFWISLATHYSIDTSLQSLRMRTAEWNGFAGGFSRRRPIALTEAYITVTGDLKYKLLDGETWDPNSESRPTRILRIPNLQRIVILHDSFLHDSDSDEEDDAGSESVAIVTRAREILQCIECEVSTQVEVCISDAVVALGEEMPTQERLLGGLSDKWVLCTHCDSI